MDFKTQTLSALLATSVDKNLNTSGTNDTKIQCSELRRLAIQELS